MDRVLVAASKVSCGAASPHQGTVSMTGAGRLKASGSEVLTTAGVSTAAVAGCTNPGNSSAPCTKVSTVSAPPNGVSTRLKVDGAFVLLESWKALSDQQSPVKVDPNAVGNGLLKAD
jgi:hypothetical protein